MHPLVRDLYKRAIVVGRDYPVPWLEMRETWKKSLRDPSNCPSCYTINGLENNNANELSLLSTASPDCEKEIRRAVARGRYMVREMIGVIQLKKYRTMKRRYYDDDHNQK